MKTSKNLGGRIWMVLLGLFLAGVGALFVAYLWGSYQRAASMDDWVAVPCTIESATIDGSGRTQHGAPKYRLEVRYAYKFGGEHRTGARVKRLPVEKSNLKAVEKMRERYPEGSAGICHVNPEVPDLAVLEKDGKGALYSIWFPGLFVVGGLGIAVSAFLPGRRQGRRD